MEYIYLPFSAHLYTQLPIGMHVPFQPNIAQNSFLPLLADMPKLVELAYQPKMDRNSFWELVWGVTTMVLGKVGIEVGFWQAS